MIKKIILAILTTMVVLSLLLTGYVYSIKEDRGAANIEPISILHNKKYQYNAVGAEQWLKNVYQNNLFPSFSVSIGIQGELVWEGVIGFSDLSNRTSANQNTRYRIGSVSKPITAAAVMRMQEKKLLSIDKSFNDYVEDYPSENSGFTIKELLTHQGGVRHYVNQFSETYSTEEYATTRKAASLVENDALLFSPGEGFHYSTYGYTLVALAMESVYSMTLEKIMHDEVFVPAGMTATKFDKADSSSKDNMAKPYLHVGSSLYQAPSVNSSYKYAGAGYLSTSSDLVRFGNSLLNNDLLTENSQEIMWSPVALDSGKMNPQNYALGFRVGEDERGRFVHHGGSIVGGFSFLLMYPELDVVIAYAANVTPSGNSFDRLQEVKELVNLFVGEI